MFRRLFAKKSTSTKFVNRKELIDHFLSYVINVAKIDVPIYCPNIKSKEQAHRIEERLPLTYIWNENPKTGTFCISVNGYAIKKILETRYNIKKEAIDSIRDELLILLCQSTNYSAARLFENSNLLPSQMFEHSNVA